MTKASLSLHLDDATTYATVYQGEKPVASVRRRRVFGESDRKTWTVYDLEGAELFQTNLGSVTIRSRLSSILKAREAAQPLPEVIELVPFEPWGNDSVRLFIDGVNKGVFSRAKAAEYVERRKEPPLAPEVAKAAVEAARASGQLQASPADFLPQGIAQAARHHWMLVGAGHSTFTSYIHAIAKEA